MADLNRITASQCVEITDGVSSTAPIATSVTGSESGLVCREARTGQTTMAASIPVCIANNQPGSLKQEDTSHGASPYGSYILALRNDNASSTVASANSNYSGLSCDSNGRLYVAAAGNVASGATDSGNPVKIGGVATTTLLTAVTSGQRVNVTCDDLGRQVVVTNQIRDLVTSGTGSITTTTETTILAAGGVGVFLDLTMLSLANETATAIRCDVRDAAAGTVRMSVMVPATGSVVVPLQTPHPQAATNNAWTAQLGATPSGGAIRVYMQAVKNA